MEIEELNKEFKKPYSIDTTLYCFEDYFGIKTVNVQQNEYKIFQHTSNLEKSFKEKMICCLLHSLNELQALPLQIQYRIPDNGSVPNYFTFDVDFGNYNEFPISQGYYKLHLPTETYLSFYDLRYHKVPLLHHEENQHWVELTHSWISRIFIC